jgi:hypothetical protein
MKLVDRQETVILVVSGAPANADRPLALALQKEIDARGGAIYRRALVIGDRPYLDRPDLHHHPTIAIGGPGVNEVAARFVPELPTLWQADEQAFVQVELATEPQRVALWGMSAAATAQAVDAFMGQGLLDMLLERIWQGNQDQRM